jgi:hypothetical protein
MEGNAGHQGNGADDSGGHASAYEHELGLLGQIRILGFTARPPRIAPFETTTLSWSVRLPPALHSVSLTVAGQTNPGSSGSVTVAPYSTTVYGILARGALARREVATLRVPVDDSTCKPGYVAGSAITGIIESSITEQLQGSSDFSLRGSGVGVTLSENIISIDIPLNLNVRHFFDAAMSIAVHIVVGMQGVPPQAAVSVQVASVEVDVSWSWYGTLLSGGCTNAVATGVERTAQAFMSVIAESQVSGIADQLSSLVRIVIANAEENDPEGRTYALTSLALTSDGITFTVCPLPASSSHDVHGPIDAPISPV